MSRKSERGVKRGILCALSFKNTLSLKKQIKVPVLLSMSKLF